MGYCGIKSGARVNLAVPGNPKRLLIYGAMNNMYSQILAITSSSVRASGCDIFVSKGGWLSASG